jgi:cytochrome c2
MFRFKWDLIKRIERLEAEVKDLRQVVSENNSHETNNRVTVTQIAELFETGSETIERMEGEFAGLRAIKKTGADNSVYWDKDDFEKWLAAGEEKAPAAKTLETETEN